MMFDMPFWPFGCYVEMYDQGEWGFSFRAESCIALTYTYLPILKIVLT